MQCMYCKGQDLDKISYNYYECRTCGKLNYEEKLDKEKSGALGEIYFAIGILAVVLIITILILLFVTAANKKQKLQSASQSRVISTEKK